GQQAVGWHNEQPGASGTSVTVLRTLDDPGSPFVVQPLRAAPPHPLPAAWHDLVRGEGSVLCRVPFCCEAGEQRTQAVGLGDDTVPTDRAAFRVSAKLSHPIRYRCLPFVILPDRTFPPDLFSAPCEHRPRGQAGVLRRVPLRCDVRMCRCETV